MARPRPRPCCSRAFLAIELRERADARALFGGQPGALVAGSSIRYTPSRAVPSTVTGLPGGENARWGFMTCGVNFTASNPTAPPPPGQLTLGYGRAPFRRFAGGLLRATCPLSPVAWPRQSRGVRACSSLLGAGTHNPLVLGSKAFCAHSSPGAGRSAEACYLRRPRPGAETHACSAGLRGAPSAATKPAGRTGSVYFHCRSRPCHASPSFPPHPARPWLGHCPALADDGAGRHPFHAAGRPSRADPKRFANQFEEFRCKDGRRHPESSQPVDEFLRSQQGGAMTTPSSPMRSSAAGISPPCSCRSA